MTLGGYQLSFVPDVEPYWIENPEIIETASGTATVTRTERIGESQIIWADYGSGLEHPHQPEDVNVVREGNLPIYRPASEPDTIAQGLAEGWIVKKDVQAHPPEQWSVGDKAILNHSYDPPGFTSILTIIDVEETGLRVQNLLGNDWVEPFEKLHRIDITGFEDVRFISDLPELKYTTPPLSKPHPPEQILDKAVAAAASNTKSSKRKRYPGKGKACGWIETRKTNRKRQKPSSYLVYRWQDAEGKHSRYLSPAIAPQVREMISNGATVSQILAVIPSRTQ